MTAPRSLMLLAAIGLSAACGPRNTFQPPPPPEVTVAPPTREDVTVYHGFPARVDAVETIELQARVPGFLTRIHFKEGAFVANGDLLFTIEPEPYEAALAGANARLAQAEASRNLAEAALQRKQRAFEKQAVSELDVLTAEADVQAAEAAVEAARAAVATAEINLSYTTLAAPVDGRISRSFVSEGNLVGAGGTTRLAVLVSTDPMQVYFSIDERRLLPRMLAAIERGETRATMPPVKLELADGAEYPLEGRIDYFDNVIDRETGTLDGRAVFANPDGLLAPGMFARILIPEQIAGALLVPELSIQRDLLGPYVLTVGADNKVESAYVELGPRLGERRVIADGLPPDARVIVKGMQRARPGLPVNPSAPGQEG